MSDYDPETGEVFEPMYPADFIPQTNPLTDAQLEQIGRFMDKAIRETVTESMERAAQAAPSQPTESILSFSDEFGEVAKALPKAQAAMTAVLKDATNTHFKTKYATLASVLAAVMPSLNANGFGVLQPAMYTGKAVRVQTMLLHESGQWVKSTLSIAAEGHTTQAIGSAITYLRRYGLMALAGVSPEEDDDGAASARSSPAASAPRAAPKQDTTRQTRPAPQPTTVVDRSSEVVPPPNSGKASEWDAWRKVVATKVNKAKTVEAIDLVVANHKTDLDHCQIILTDTWDRLNAVVAARKQAIEKAATREESAGLQEGAGEDNYRDGSGSGVIE